MVPFSSASAAVPKERNKKEILEKIGRAQIPFIENKGQIDENVKFYARIFNGTLFITGKGIDICSDIIDYLVDTGTKE